MTENNNSIEDFEEKVINSRKKIAILFIKEIIEDHSNYAKMLSTSQIIGYLDAYPYSITLERKSVSRAIETLSDYYPSIVKDPNTGKVWFDKASSDIYPAA